MATKNQKPKPKENEIIIVDAEILSREAPESRVMKPDEILQTSMNSAQLAIVTGQTPKWAIKARQGRGGQIFKYVPHGYVTDTLNKAFGFDWDLIIDPISSDGKLYELMIEKDKDGKEVRHIAVSGHISVRVKNKKGELVTEIKKSGFGSAIWLPTMEFGDALKSARSDLVKTCGFQLGIALDLYYNERAELEQYAERINKKNASQQVADEFNKEPTTGIALLTHAMSDYDLDGEQLEKVAGENIDIIMAMNEKQISAIWEKVKKKYGKKK